MTMADRKHYEYPKILYCDKCREDVEPVIRDTEETMIKGEEEIQVPYQVAVCGKCGNMLCSRDLDEVILAMARADGMIREE